MMQMEPPCPLVRRQARWLVVIISLHGDDELLIDLASMGSYGKHPRNIYTQLKTKIQRTHVVPTLMFIPLVLNILKSVDRGVHALQHAWIPPHLFLNFLYVNFYTQFMERVVGPTGAIS